MARKSRWVLVPRANATASTRLVCFPHAGGGASTYFSWGAALQPVGIEVRSVQYPGRESRFSEPPIDDVSALVRALAESWDEISGGGACAFYGHSMGALLAFELAADLLKRGAANQPRHLFLSGHPAAHLPYRPPRVHQLPPAQFLPAVNLHFGGIPDELLEAPDVAEMIAGTLRNDFTLVENYTWTGSGPINAPINALGGADDPWTTRAELEAWATHTRSALVVQILPGDHFFTVTARDAVCKHITDTLRPPGRGA